MPLIPQIFAKVLERDEEVGLAHSRKVRARAMKLNASNS